MGGGEGVGGEGRGGGEERGGEKRGGGEGRGRGEEGGGEERGGAERRGEEGRAAAWGEALTTAHSPPLTSTLLCVFFLLSMLQTCVAVMSSARN